MSAAGEIEKGVPLPGDGGRKKGGGLSGLGTKMEVGDSFVVPAEYKAPRMVACNMNRYLAPRRFTCREQDDGTYRIWRVS